jgi:hypothetical protein
VLGNLARDAGLVCVAQEEPHSEDDRVRGKLHSHWVAMAEREADLGATATDRRWHA